MNRMGVPANVHSSHLTVTKNAAQRRFPSASLKLPSSSVRPALSFRRKTAAESDPVTGILSEASPIRRSAAAIGSATPAGNPRCSGVPVSRGIHAGAAAWSGKSRFVGPAAQSDFVGTVAHHVHIPDTPPFHSLTQPCHTGQCVLAPFRAVKRNNTGSWVTERDGRTFAC